MERERRREGEEAAEVLQEKVARVLSVREEEVSEGKREMRGCWPRRSGPYPFPRRYSRNRVNKRRRG